VVERFYVQEALNAFHARLFPASIVMLGCAAEFLIERLAGSLALRTDGVISRTWKRLSAALESRWSTLFPDHRVAARLAVSNLYLVVKTARDESGHPQLVPPSVEEARTALLAFPEGARYACEILRNLARGSTTTPEEV
jgi:hypothetical protein